MMLLGYPTSAVLGGWITDLGHFVGVEFFSVRSGPIAFAIDWLILLVLATVQVIVLFWIISKVVARLRRGARKSNLS